MADDQQSSTNWTALASAAGLLVIVVGAFWALAFGPIQEKFAVLSQRDNELRAEFTRNSDARRQEIMEMRADLERRRDGIFVSVNEFKQMAKMVEAHQRGNADALKALREIYLTKAEFDLYRAATRFQLDSVGVAINRIENTRPTAGELSAVATSNKDSTLQLESRVRSLEDYVRAIRPQGSLAPIGQTK